LVFNKIDIYSKDELEDLRKLIQQYQAIGYECLEVSALAGTNIEALKELMHDKVSLVSGHSGVGKSALINALDPEKDIRIGDISEMHSKGTHTTTFAEMHNLSFGAYIIDSPGIKEFGLFDFEKSELSQYFPEMNALAHDCKFNNCTHVHEPGCAVKLALGNGEIIESRYENYLNMLAGEEMNLTDYNAR
jgi:ribosome biogenesis GTPase